MILESEKFGSKDIPYFAIKVPDDILPKKICFCDKFFYFFYFEGFTSIPTALAANDRNRRIQVDQASDG